MCSECSGQNTITETNNIEKINILNLQIKELSFNLLQIKHDNKDKEKNIIPSYEQALKKYQHYVIQTLHDLKAGADSLYLIQRKQKNKEKREKRIKNSVHKNAKNVLQQLSKKQTGAALMKTLGLKMTKIEFKSGTRAKSYQNAREKLHTIGIEGKIMQNGALFNFNIFYSFFLSLFSKSFF